MQKDGQMSFTDAEFLLQKKQTRRERFLAQLDELVPWTDLLAVIEPHYPRSGHRGRQPIGLEVMLRIHLVQLAYNYSDPAMEDALVEIPLLRQFCRVGMKSQMNHDLKFPAITRTPSLV